jgi:hypothetical protein
MLPRAFKVRSDPEVELDTLFTTVMSPVLSTTMLLCPMAVTKSLFRMFAVPEVLDRNTPLTKLPSVVPDEVMFTVDAVKEEASWIVAAVLGELELLLVLAMTLNSYVAPSVRPVIVALVPETTTDWDGVVPQSAEPNLY